VESAGAFLMLNNSHTVIICTRNRPTQVTRIISNLAECEAALSLKIIIVDNSDDQHGNDRDMLLLRSKFADLRIVVSEPGLPRARNTGLLLVEKGIVTFFDDDAEIPKEYFVSMDKLFDLFPELGGSSPVVSSTEPQSRLVRLLSNYYAGRITKFGHTYWYSEKNLKGVDDAQWMPGCAMTFRVSAIDKLRFNENLEKGPLGGYALGEDVDFSMRLNMSAKILVNLDLEIAHFREVAGRPNHDLVEEGVGRWLAYLSRTLPKVNPLFVLAVLTIQCLLTFFQSKEKLRTRPSSRLIRIRAFLSEYNQGTLIDPGFGKNLSEGKSE
jgi:GT2 family glycosyltransferase